MSEPLPPAPPTLGREVGHALWSLVPRPLVGFWVQALGVEPGDLGGYLRAHILGGVTLAAGALLLIRLAVSR